MSDYERIAPDVVFRIWSKGYAGIAAPCVLGSSYTNWTAFESHHEANDFRVERTVVRAASVALDNPELIEALNILRMSIDRDTLFLRATPGELAPADTSHTD